MLMNLLPLIAFFVIAIVGIIIGRPPNAPVVAIARIRDTDRRSADELSGSN